jgi:hypothetical protein
MNQTNTQITYKIQTNTTTFIQAYPWYTGVPLAENCTEFFNQQLNINEYPEQLVNLLMVRYNLVFNDIRINRSNRHSRSKSMQRPYSVFTTILSAVTSGNFYLKTEDQ